VVDNDSDEQLGALLESTLRTHLGTDQVDARALIRGSRRRAKRVRSQRIAALTTAAVLVVAVPVGYEVISPDPHGVAQPAAMLPSNQAALTPGGAHPTQRSTSPQSPSGSAGADPARAIPDSLAFGAAELPSGLTLYWASGPSAGSPTVNGQDCQAADASSSRPITGRQWLWSTNSGKLTDLGVTLTVTSWAPGSGSRALADLIHNTGACRWSDPQQVRAFTASDSDQSWASTSSRGQLHYARSVIRVGDVIAGIEVQHPDGTKAAAVLADHLARIEAKQLQNQQ
jgi:hypothetical protein